MADILKTSIAWNKESLGKALSGLPERYTAVVSDDGYGRCEVRITKKKMCASEARTVYVSAETPMEAMRAMVIDAIDDWIKADQSPDLAGGEWWAE